MSTISVQDEPTIQAFLRRLRAACKANKVQVDVESQQDAEDLGFGVSEIENTLMGLEVDDFEKKVPSTRFRGHDVWVFTPRIDEDLALWIRVVELSVVVVFSFHDRDRDEE